MQHGLAIKRNFKIVNLDPAAEHFKYPVAVDIRDLISLDDVVEELEYGPNGGRARHHGFVTVWTCSLSNQ